MTITIRPLVTLLAAAGMAACSMKSLVDVDVPETVVEPSAVQNPVAAGRFAEYAMTRFDQIFGGNSGGIGNAIPFPPTSGDANFILGVGILTDEVKTNASHNMDDRNMTDDVSNSDMYQRLGLTRNGLFQAREGLRRFAPNTAAAQAHLQALQGFTVIWLAELFCTGVPIGYSPMEGVPTLLGGQTTDQLMTHAVALFDSALALSTDSTRFVNLAKIGKARALLAKGEFAAAAAAAQDVPTDFVYLASRFNTSSGNILGNNPRTAWWVQDNEGTNGLVWSTDPRPGLRVSGGRNVVAKYSVTATGTLDPAGAFPLTPVPVATGLEARLIEAEAALAAGNSSWLATLNTLRATCVGTAACAPVPGLTAAQLPPLADPGNADARVNLLFRERAMWLYMTGHRNGDLRRLARHYDRPVSSLWPAGIIVSPASTSNGREYGSSVAYGPYNEFDSNPYYTQRCDNREP